jgi:hypothetical protein
MLLVADRVVAARLHQVVGLVRLAKALLVEVVILVVFHPTYLLAGAAITVITQEAVVAPAHKELQGYQSVLLGHRKQRPRQTAEMVYLHQLAELLNFTVEVVAGTNTEIHLQMQVAA